MYLDDYVCSHAVLNSSPFNFACIHDCPHTLTSSFSIPNHICCFTISSPNQQLLNPTNELHEPANYEEAAAIPAWQDAMQQEFSDLEANNTWEEAVLPEGKKPISSKWVYKIKRHADGTIERYKGRLVIKGCTQKAGIDYTETFSPVVKMTTIRSLIATAVKMHWPMHQLDVNNAFLHGDLNEDIYMKPPPGLILSDLTKVLKLKKLLYGLKQASSQWHAKLSTALRSRGYIQSKNDYSLFYKAMGKSIIFVAVYVDDILLTGNHLEEMHDLKAYLHSTFKIKDLGSLHYFLGIEILQASHGVIMTQRKFAAELLKEFDHLIVAPAHFPFGN